eukprot:s10468_g1.t1
MDDLQEDCFFACRGCGDYDLCLECASRVSQGLQALPAFSSCSSFSPPSRSVEEQAHQHVEQSQQVMVEQFQAHFAAYEAYDKDADHASLRDPGKFLTLDTKLLAALTEVARGELSREILIFKETEATKSRAVRGRQVLYLFDQYFK